MIESEKLIETLGRSDLFHAYEIAFNEVTGMPLKLRPLETWDLALHGSLKENPFCARMSEQSATCAACLQMQAQLAKDALDKPATLTCVYGLSETAAPIKVGPATIGFLQTGQVLSRKATAAAFQRAVNAGATLGVNLDNNPVREAFFATPVASQKKLEAVASLLKIFAEHLSIKSNELVVQAAHAEVPAITRAKQFIRDHHREELSLGSVATAMNTSSFYFCKQFHKVTGMTFTQFVSRTRIENAKELLLNPHLRVSEVAFESGFQSLTHFNRMFAKIMGESPTDYRNKLPVRMDTAPVKFHGPGLVAKPAGKDLKRFSAKDFVHIVPMGTNRLRSDRPKNPIVLLPIAV